MKKAYWPIAVVGVLLIAQGTVLLIYAARFLYHYAFYSITFGMMFIGALVALEVRGINKP